MSRLLDWPAARTTSKIRSAAGACCNVLLEHDLCGKPVPTPDHVRGRLFLDHAVSDSIDWQKTQSR
jgi:hypothetical protein